MEGNFVNSPERNSADTFRERKVFRRWLGIADFTPDCFTPTRWDYPRILSRDLKGFRI